MDLAKIKIDSAKGARGDWVGDIPGLEGLRLKVRGLASETYREAIGRRTRAVPRSARLRDGSIPVKLMDRLTGEALHEAALLDWDGLTENDAAVPFDRALALKLLTDPDFALFREGVIFAAAVVAEADRAAEEQTLGNSAAPSSGSSNGASTTSS